MSGSDTSYRYSAFGLTVSSDIQFPELTLTSTEKSPNVLVKRGSISVSESTSTRPRVVFEDATEFTLLYESCNLLVKDGEQIVVDPRRGSSRKEVRWTVLGPAFNFLVHQRNHLVLHGSTVSIDGCAVAFIGESGAGKSTTAAAFVDEGHSVLSDDVVAVNTSATQPTVQPAFSSVKLHNDIASRFGERLVPILKDETKQDSNEGEERFYGTQNPHTTPLPLRAIYCLSEEDDFSVSRIEPAAAAIELAQTTYTVGTQRHQREALRALEDVSRVAENVPVSRMSHPHEFEALTDIVRFVEKEVSV